MTQRILADDIVRFRDGNQDVATLFWGDRVEEVGDNRFLLQTTEWDDEKKDYVLVERTVRAREQPRFQDEGVFKVRIVDVGQGDGAVIETPDDRLTVVDGGLGPWFRRYLHRAFAHRLVDGPIPLDAIVVTHGDADHYDGLIQLLNRKVDGKPLVTTTRVFHNGLIKGSGENHDLSVFGDVENDADGRPWITTLVDDVIEVDDAKLNRPFASWKKALQNLKDRVEGLEIRRIEVGNDDKFAFLDANVQVLGPITSDLDGKPALPALTNPEGGFSVGHMINGHSIVLKLTIGKVRILFGADLNEASEQQLLTFARENGISLQAEVLKVPHHGSHEFIPELFEQIEPVVSIVSSGDQAIGGSDHIHPRAGLVGALGKYSRESVKKPLVYVTEMVAYFRPVDKALEVVDGEQVTLRNAHEKKTFGIVHVRTDGRRVLVATHSGQDTRKESYVFTIEDDGTITFSDPRII